MPSYCLKYRKNIEIKHPKVIRTKMEEKCSCQNVQCVIQKNQNL